jgi:ADP-ribosylglycohydrolase
MSETLEKIHGCLVGVAAGDAMGMPSSMMSPDMIKRIFNQYIDEFLPAPEGHIIHNNMCAGEVTDDTQQTLVIADSVIDQGLIEPDDIAQRLIRWAESVNAFDSDVLGPSSLRSLRAIKLGKSIYESGAMGDTNGAAMRISAIGIYGQGDLEKTVESVTLACQPTHNTNIAIAGASAVAMAIGSAIRGESDVETIIDLALQAADKGMHKGNIWYGASIKERTRVALSLLNGNSGKEEVMRALYDIIGAGVAMTETIPVCLAMLKMGNGNPVECIKIATNLGGDCDTTASIVGAMSGAMAGVTAFPPHWIDKLEKVNKLNLNQYAADLYKIICKSSG